MLHRRSRSPSPHLRGSRRPPARFHHHLPAPGALAPPHYPPEYPWVDDPRIVVQRTRSLSLPSDQQANLPTPADNSSPRDGPPLYSSVPPIDLPGYPEAYVRIAEPKPTSLKRPARLLPFSRPLGTLPPWVKRPRDTECPGCEQSADISLEDIPRPYTCKPPDAQGPHVVPAEWFEANTALENEERDKVISADQASGLFQADFPPYFLHDGLVVHRKRTCNCVKEVRRKYLFTRCKHRCCEMCLPDPPGCCGITQDAIPTHFLEDDDKCPTCLEVAAHYTVKTCGHITCTFCWKECLYNAMPDCTQCEFELLVFPPMGFNPYSFELVTYQTSLTAYPDLKPPETWPEKPDQPDETSEPGVHNAEEKTSDNSDMIKRGALTSVI